MSTPTGPDAHLDEHLRRLRDSTDRLGGTVVSLTTSAWRGPSLLPGWSRAHVVAHLVLNAEGMGRAVAGVSSRTPTPVYASAQAREDDIVALSGGDPEAIIERLSRATDALEAALQRVPDDRWDVVLDRLPGAPFHPVRTVPMLRWRELEIHHADLDAGYGPSDWPTGFASTLLDQLAADRATAGQAYRLHAEDLGREWAVGSGGPMLYGSAAALAWWLSGRGNGAGIRLMGGEPVPDPGPWR